MNRVVYRASPWGSISSSRAFDSGEKRTSFSVTPLEA